MSVGNRENTTPVRIYTRKGAHAHPVISSDPPPQNNMLYEEARSANTENVTNTLTARTHLFNLRHGTGAVD